MNPIDNGALTPSGRPEECGMRSGVHVCHLPKGHEVRGIVHQLEPPERVPKESAQSGPVTAQLIYWQNRTRAAEARSEANLRELEDWRARALHAERVAAREPPDSYE